MNKPLQVGLLVDGTSVGKTTYDLVYSSLRSKGYEVSALIVLDKIVPPSANPLHRIISVFRKYGVIGFIETLTLKAIIIFESFFLIRDRDLKDQLYSHDISQFDIPKIIINPTVSKSGLILRVDNEIEKISSLKLDVLIRCGSGILKGSILNVCEFGVLSFHHGDNRVNRGGPPAFWEVRYKLPSTGFIIQRLTDELDGGDVVFRGNIPTDYSYARNLARLYRKSGFFMANFLEQLAIDRAYSEIESKVPYSHRLFRRPSIIHQFSYIIGVTVAVFNKSFRLLTRNPLTWGVGFQFVNHWRDSVLHRCKIIENPIGSFLADPFVIYRDNRYFCFMEEYQFSRDKGVISVYEIREQSVERLGVVIDESFHLSFPFLFEMGEDLYMCPETSEANEIRLYKCVSFPYEWRYEKTLMHNVSAVDTMIFEKDSIFWMLTNICSAGAGENATELHIFWSNNFLSDEWHKHPANPVIFDSRYARNGGLIFDGEEILRVFQKQGYDVYGESFGIAKITEITKTTFIEEEITTITPDFLPALRGTHTLSNSHGLVAIDFCKQ